MRLFVAGMAGGIMSIILGVRYFFKAGLCWVYGFGQWGRVFIGAARIISIIPGGGRGAEAERAKSMRGGCFGFTGGLPKCYYRRGGEGNGVTSFYVWGVFSGLCVVGLGGEPGGGIYKGFINLGILSKNRFK